MARVLLVEILVDFAEDCTTFYTVMKRTMAPRRATVQWSFSMARNFTRRDFALDYDVVVVHAADSRTNRDDRVLATCPIMWFIDGPHQRGTTQSMS